MLGHSAPGRHPIPERLPRMTLQPPSSRIRGIVQEPAHEHVIHGHDAEKFRMIAQFRVIVWRRRRGRCHPPPMLRERLNQGHRGFTGEVLQD